MDLREVPSVPARRHPWEMARAHFFEQLLMRALPPGSSLKMLDVGSGDAWFAARVKAALQQPVDVCCWDSEYAHAPVAAAVARDVPHLRLVAEAPSENFNLVTMMDVLEHVEDAPSFLRTVIDRCLAPGGFLLASVPAWHQLYSQHDRFLGHFKRYAPREGAQLLQAAGLHIAQQGGLFHALLVPRAMQVMRERLMQPAAKAQGMPPWRHGRAVTATVSLALRADLWVSRRLANRGINLPGLSWWALCRKPQAPGTA